MSVRSDVAARAAEMPPCPSEDCPACNGEQCWLCGAGWGSVDLDRKVCHHDAAQRHTHPPKVEIRERPANGWHTIELAEQNGKSLIEAYLGELYERQQEEWGRAYGRAVFEAFPDEGPCVSDFVEDLIERLESSE